MAGSTMTRDDVEQRQRARRSEDLHRKIRTEILGLPYCLVCGGATAGTDDLEVTCVCNRRLLALQLRISELAERHTGDRPRHWQDDRE